MRKYEIIVIVDPDVDERQVPTLIDKHLKTITTGNGTVELSRAPTSGASAASPTTSTRSRKAFTWSCT